VELLLNGKSLGKKNVDLNLYKSLWSIQFQPGTIKAIGIERGKKLQSMFLKLLAMHSKYRQNPSSLN